MSRKRLQGTWCSSRVLAIVTGALMLGAGASPAAVADSMPALAEVADVECDQAGFDDRCELWSVDGTSDDRVVVSPTGDRLFVWRAGSPQIVARDAAGGQEQWTTTVTGINSPNVPVSGLTASPDGSRIYTLSDDLAIDAISGRDRDLVVSAHSAATGERLWTRSLGLPAIDENDRYVTREQVSPTPNLGVNGVAIAVSPDGRRVYVAGDTRLWDRILGDWVINDDIVVAGYDAVTGQREWVSTWEEETPEMHARFLTVSPDSRTVYLAGTWAPCGLGRNSCPPDFLTLAFRAYDPSAPAQEGVVLWDQFYDGTGGGPDEPVAMDLAPGGSRLYLTGDSAGAAWSPTVRDDFDWATVAYDTGFGAEVWVSRFSGPEDVRPDPVSRHYPDGRQLPAGLVASPAGDRVHVAGTFEAHAVADYRDITGTPTDGAPTVHEATLDYNVTTGERESLTQFTTLTSVAAPLLGPYHANPDTSAASVAVSPDGATVYALGADSQADSAQVTAAYDAASGGQQWVARVPGLNPAQLEVSADGSLLFAVSINGSIHAYATEAETLSGVQGSEVGRR